LVFISNELIKIVEKAYQIKLPNFKHWFLQRVDIAICYDLNNQENIKTYINNLNCCNYPRRKLKHYEEESLYLTGSTTTLKIYNKLKEFEKHDIKKFKNTNFNLIEYLEKIKGYIRFECEIKKRKLKSVFMKNHVRINCITYSELKNIWYLEFCKLLKMLNNNLFIVQKREDVKQRLSSIYTKVRARNLYNFYLLILLEGLQEIKKTTNKSMYYKNIADLKKANIDFAQKLELDTSDNIVYFNPFECEEIL